MSKYYKAEDIINLLKAHAKDGANMTLISDETALAIESLTTIEVSEDCMSRKWLEEHKKVISYTNEWRETETDEFVSLENIENAPSVVPTQTNANQRIESVGRAEGEWIVSEDGDTICSVCGALEGEFIFGTKNWYGLGISNYCPSCGAKMKGE